MSASATALTAQDIMNAIKNCYDPEIPVNIVDLGLIYDVKVSDGNVSVKMSLTSRGCPSAAQLPESVREEVLKLSSVKDVQVDVVWEPPWSPERMSDWAKRQLGIGGVAAPQVNADITKPIKKGSTNTQPDGTTVLVNERNMSYKVTPEVITFWNMCDGQKTVNQLANSLAAEMKSNVDEIRPQIVDLVVKLIEADLLG